MFGEAMRAVHYRTSMQKQTMVNFTAVSAVYLKKGNPSERLFKEHFGATSPGCRSCNLGMACY
jgi:hypothetical protein